MGVHKYLFTFPLWGLRRISVGYLDGVAETDHRKLERMVRVKSLRISYKASNAEIPVPDPVINLILDIH